MAHWLLKSEPDDWSWAEQVAKGRDGAEWTGIRNFSAQRHLRAMKKGEQAFFYHTGKERAIVGIVKVIAEAHPDSTDSAWRAAAQIPPRDAGSRLLREGFPPFTVLLTLPGAYSLIRPFLGDRAVTAISWVFVLLLLATAAWLGSVLYHNADALVIGAAKIRHQISESGEHRELACEQCKALNSMTAKLHQLRHTAQSAYSSR